MKGIRLRGQSGLAWCAIAVACLLLATGSAGADDTIVVTNFTSDKLVDSAPAGWKLEQKGGTLNLAVEKRDDTFVLHLKSDSTSSYGIAREIEIKAETYPFLAWKWKVEKLPAGGDVRSAGTDDQAVQVYVLFEETGWPAKLKTPIVAYIWDNECPKGTVVTSPQPFAEKVRYVVLRDKTDRLGTWFTEKRNVFDDYMKLFPDIDGGKPRNIKAISLYINSQHTKSEAESYIGEMYFSKD